MNEKQISLLAAFAAAGVEFAVVGGLAVNAHGYARATHDLNIFIRPTAENARAAFGALLGLGILLEGLEPGDLTMRRIFGSGQLRTTSIFLRRSERWASTRFGGTG